MASLDRNNGLLSMDALSLSRAIREEGKITCEQLMQATLDIIDELNPHYNAIIMLKDRGVLMEQARDCDRALSAAKKANSKRKPLDIGELDNPRYDHSDDDRDRLDLMQAFGWLYGIPVAIKDVSNAESFPTTMGGSPLFCSGNPGDANLPLPATVSDPYVAAIIRDGAIIIGKTNAPEGGLGSNTFNDLWGKTLNALVSRGDGSMAETKKAVSAGGSSGGAAVAIATHMLALADGTDNMGSLRNPAGWNGIYSHRPTAGWIQSAAKVGDNNCEQSVRDSKESNVHTNSGDDTPFFSSVSRVLPHPASTPGPMARTPLDCARLLQTMVGDQDRFDANALILPPKHPFGDASPEATVRIGWLGDWQGQLPIEDGILSACQTALDEWSARSGNGNHRRCFERRNHTKVVVVNIANVTSALSEENSTACGNLFDLELLWESYNTIRFASTYETYSTQFDVKHLLSQQGRHLIKRELAWELEQGQAIASSSDRGKARLERARGVYDAYEGWLKGIFRQRKNGDGEGGGNEVQNEYQGLKVDVLALPSAQVWPFPIEDRYPKEICGTTMDTYHRWMEICVPVSFGGLPCVTVPITGTPSIPESNGKNNIENEWMERKRIPMGLQLFATRGKDLQLLNLAADYYHSQMTKREARD